MNFPKAFKRKQFVPETDILIRYPTFLARATTLSTNQYGIFMSYFKPWFIYWNSNAISVIQ